MPDEAPRAPVQGSAEAGRAATGVGREPAGSAEAGPDRMARAYARARERDEAARAALVPLAPGERPRAVTVAAIVALVFAAANVAATALSHPSGPEWRAGIAQAVVLVVAAAGMWRAKYWAVLGFQALLALACVIAFLSLLRASNVAGVLYCLAILAVCGPLFYRLVNAMARLQMPRRRAPR